MNDTHIPFRKILVNFVAGLVGAAGGDLLVKFAISQFAGSPTWELPGIVVGALAALVVTVLVALTFMQERRAAKRHIRRGANSSFKADGYAAA